MKKEKTAPEAQEEEKTEQPAPEPAQPDEAAQPDTSAEPSEEEKLRTQLKEEKDKYLRLYAEYDNYRKRTTAEKLQIYDDATARAIKEILPLCDSVTQALAQFEGKDIPAEFSKGISLIANQLKSSMDKLKVEAFCEIGDAFDPALHNAVSMTEDDSLPANVVAAVYQKGYRIGDKIIRHAMVVVANA